MAFFSTARRNAVVSALYDKLAQLVPYPWSSPSNTIKRGSDSGRQETD